MASKRLIVAGMTAMLLVMLPFFGDAASAAAGPEGPDSSAGMTAPPMKIDLKEGLISIDVRDAEIGAVLRAVAERAGIGLTVGSGVGGRVSITLAGVSLEEALRRLCESRAILYEYDPETRSARIVGAGAFAGAPRSPSGLRADAAVPALTAPAPADKTPKEEAPSAAGISPPPVGQSRGMAGKGRLYDSQGRPLYKPHELLVRFRPEATTEQIAALHRSLGSVVLKSLDRLKLHCVRLREELAEGEGISLYAAAGIVASAERHALRYPMLVPNDLYFTDFQWGMTKIQMPAAWEKSTGNTNIVIGVIVIGVIDTGVDARHPDLTANLLPGRDLAGYVRLDQTDADANPMDLDGHGTHVAGIIAAVGNNGLGVAGIGWNLRVMPLKVQADDATQSRYMETFDIVAAIEYAVAQRVRIVNCSFGGEGNPSQEEYNAFSRLGIAGILAICAAGNGNINNDTDARRMYPASYDLDNIISVAASNQMDTLANSNYGKTSVDLMAPGEDIYSTHLCPESVDKPNCCPQEISVCGPCTSRSGTSMATPHVTGVAGLILSRNPNLGYARVKSVLLESVDLIPAVSNLLASGGRLNALSALSQTCLPAAVTGGEEIGLADVIAALQVAARMETAFPVCRTADVDGDDRIGLAEAVYGLQLLSGLRSE
ncbi:MAG: S8 family serine peptidase [Deltaproteobacteria bacterium]|nr:S8 family serine peptidase [Deltaproteobacteria bacterium]